MIVLGCWLFGFSPLALATEADDHVLESGTAETLVQVRTDIAGAAFFGGLESLSGVAELGPARIEGYGQIGLPGGLTAPIGGELFLLTADGRSGPIDWTIGRQPLLLPSWNRRLDGAAVRWSPGGPLSLSLAGGLASQAGLSGTLGGAPVARLSAAYAGEASRATVGVWGEAGEVPAGHADVELRWASASRRAPQLGALLAGGASEGARVLERARVEAGLLPTSGVRTLAWVEHREALVTDADLSPSIFATFAPAGSDAVGLAAGITDRKQDRLWASGSVQRWSYGTATDATETGEATETAETAETAEPVTGLVGELRWEPRCAPGHWCVTPGWQGATGDGGFYHRIGGVVALPLAAPVALDAAWVPYRKPHLALRSAWVVGATASVSPGERLALKAGGDVLIDTGTIAPRAWFALALGPGGSP